MKLDDLDIKIKNELLEQRKELCSKWKQNSAYDICFTNTEIVPAADVLEDYELEYIQHVIKPRPKQCYRNSHLLCEAFPERILYCEGKTNVPIPIDHAFNKVGDAYIDITFEFAFHENPSIYEYVTFGEYDAKTIRKAVLETGYYGEIYKWLYYQSKK